MTQSIVIELTDAEALAILNALNYFGHGCSASECSTLLGMGQDDVRGVFKRIREVQMRTTGPTEDP